MPDSESQHVLHLREYLGTLRDGATSWDVGPGWVVMTEETYLELCRSRTPFADQSKDPAASSTDAFPTSYANFAAQIREMEQKEFEMWRARFSGAGPAR